MRNWLRTAVAALGLAVAFSGGFASESAAQEKMYFASVGSGGLDGGYYRTAKAICAEVNQVDRKHFRCSPETTQGSIYNLRALLNGELEFALVQSDWLHAAFTGSSYFKSAGPNQALRTVMGLYVEPLTLLTRRAANIRSFRDLVGKRVDLGNPSSGRRATMEVAMKAFGINQNDFASVQELQTSGVLQALCENKVDAVGLVVGHPSPLVARALKECDVVLTPVSGPEIDALVAKAPYYQTVQLKSEKYEMQVSDIATFGVKATLVTMARIPDAVVERVTATIIKHWDHLKSVETILASSSLDAMQTGTKAAPAHPGTIAAFKKNSSWVEGVLLPAQRQ